MPKLRLDLDALQVESFAVPAPTRQGGTVHGKSMVEYPDVGDSYACGGAGGGGYTQGTCIGPTFCCPPTWRPTCMVTCADTCGGISCLADWCSLLCP